MFCYLAGHWVQTNHGLLLLWSLRWSFKCCLVVKAFPHSEQVKGRFPVCWFMWTVKWDFCTNALLHTEHWCGLWLVCNIMCFASTPLETKHFPHWGQTWVFVFSPGPTCTVAMCCVTCAFCENIFWHIGHPWGFSPEWVRRCFWSCEEEIHTRWHPGWGHKCWLPCSLLSCIASFFRAENLISQWLQEKGWTATGSNWGTTAGSASKGICWSVPSRSWIAACFLIFDAIANVFPHIEHM